MRSNVPVKLPGSLHILHTFVHFRILRSVHNTKYTGASRPQDHKNPFPSKEERDGTVCRDDTKDDEDQG